MFKNALKSLSQEVTRSKRGVSKDSFQGQRSRAAAGPSLHTRLGMASPSLQG